MLLLDGKALQIRLAQSLKEKVEDLGAPLKLAIIQVGDREESNRYIRHKIAFGEKVGISVELIKLPQDVREEELVARINTLNSDVSVAGIIVQSPLPAGLDFNIVIEHIDPKKDVDGLTSDSYFVPATARAVMKILEEYKINPKGKNAVVIGRSRLVGAPVAELLQKADAVVDVVHSQTLDPQSITRQADIVVVAIGKPKHVTEDFIKLGAVVVDVGINAVEDKLVGDVDFDKVKNIVAAITPVPGGVGPMTVYSLFENVYLAARAQARA